MDDVVTYVPMPPTPVREWSLPEAIPLSPEEVAALMREHDDHEKVHGFGNEC
jgi:hypothetical protein